jgi:TPR repeat protein
MGDLNGCANIAIRYLFQFQRRSDEDVARALDSLEKACNDGTWTGGCYFVGNAYETGRGRPIDPQRAIDYYERCGDLYSFKGIARIALTGDGITYDLSPIATALGRAAQANDAESCWYLGYMFHQGTGVPRDDRKARIFLNHACLLEFEQACDALQQSTIPPFENPTMMVPGWLTAYPLQSDSQ